MEIPPEKLETCLEVLQHIADCPSAIDGNKRMMSLVAKINREGKRRERRALIEARQAELRRLNDMTAIVDSQRTERRFAALPAGGAVTGKTLGNPVYCYVCKKEYTELHFFYHKMCPECAEFNYAKRDLHADLKGRTALVTGGRIKIGYQLALRMLQDGARVLVTTRFPRDAAARFSAEPDLAEWQDRLQIFGVDFRNLPAVDELISHLLRTEPHLDIIINNAAQTIKRPLAFYQNIIDKELSHTNLLPEQARHLLAPAVSRFRPMLEAASERRGEMTALPADFPAEIVDADGQPIDMRPTNSWALKLDEVDVIEMLEVQLINSTAPFMLNSRLKPLLLRSPFARRFIVNVSAMEGQFNRGTKTEHHPHTNMAKAALNMMTRTSAADYARDGIFMNSVDTGWITDENPYAKRVRLRENDGFYTPLDVIDGAARVYDPVVQGIEDPAAPQFGHFLKDYAPCPW